MRKIVSGLVIVAYLHASLGLAMQERKSGLPGRDSSRSFQQDDPSQEHLGGDYMSDKDVSSKAMSAADSTLASVAYQIHIVGEVARPGTYRIAASDRLQEALQRAGGLTARGSLRRIELRRQGEGSRRYDLQRFRMQGDLSLNPFLFDNDTIVVPLKRTVVRVVGAVRRPEEYELLNERSLAKIIQMAGGTTTACAHNDPVKIIRFDTGEKQVLPVPQTAEELRDFRVQASDIIFVPSVLTAGKQFDYNVEDIPGNQIFYPTSEDRVFVLGGVGSPGPYGYSPFRNIHQYLSLAGGVTKLSQTKKMRILHMDGSSQAVSSLGAPDILNPGDTIFVPERRLPPEAKMSIVFGVLSSILGTTTAAIALSRF